MWFVRTIAIAFAVLWLAGAVVMVWFRITDLIKKEEKISMAYHKVENDDDGTPDDVKDEREKAEADLEFGVDISDDDNEAASDEARDLMRQVNGVVDHAQAIERLLASIPPSTARSVAEQKIREVVMWAGQAFIDSET